MPPSVNTLFKFTREGYSVNVTNIADAVSKREILDLFNNLIGDISKCEELCEGGRRYFSLTFNSQDTAKKALCMSGYNVDGSPLVVAAVQASEAPRIAKPGKQSDTRRNLYVLGLPFDLTKTEFSEIFSRFGTVAHAVILATVDNASRRRGFIVMNQHQEARAAMDALNRKELKGHIIDVSWAVVQRSEGFLDGGDRATVLSNPSPSPSPLPFDVKSISPTLPPLQASIIVTPPIERPPPSRALPPSPALIIRNLPAMLFSQVSDLHPLLGPYGDVKKLEIRPTSGERHFVSAMVEYASVSQAAEAAQALHGQAYSNTPISVEFVRDLLGRVDPQAGLNPHAAPFMTQTGLPDNAALTSVTPLYPGSNISHANLAALSKGGLLAVNPHSLSPYGAPLLYVPFAGVRPSSAPTTLVLPMISVTIR
ncbi:uncharacterized protein BXZ73DRAFT_41748 [Epithele typhae]|uniref:uncharacterized protein n=1 Tax=Epithele typhae TaxID=378194 RepID=UPI002008DADE|nr:uncharacterized protein BXZ73DRAFT_41748 [Epithele typhae]KAH9941800.1 hypothetical protein BXZ73DRAFT_41748 [Epithele typhae]